MIKVEKPGHDVVNKHLITRGFDTRRMQGCGRRQFPNASSIVSSMDWASNTAMTTWSWDTMYQYNIDLETSCAPDDKIWFYNVHVRASNDEIANGAELMFEFNIDNIMRIATDTIDPISLYLVTLTSQGVLPQIPANKKIGKEEVNIRDKL